MTAKFKKPIALLLAVTMAMLLNFPNGIFGILTANAADVMVSKPTGDGSVGSPYQIATPEELYWFAGLVNGTLTDSTVQNTSANAVLTADITINNGLLTSLAFDQDGNVTNGDSFADWTPIGSSSNQYTGTFDGQGHTISGLYSNNKNTDCVGLVGYVGSGGSILSVGVAQSYFKGNSKVGGVCGYNDGKIEKCYNTGTVGGVDEVGGVCGFNYCGTIKNCYSTGAVSGGQQVGGVVGDNDYGTIENCYNTGSVKGTNNVGGVCGYNCRTIKNCYYNSTVYTGSAYGTNNGTVSDNVSGKTTDEFASGAVAYLLNGSTGESALVWGQTLTGETKDVSPVFNNGKNAVYYASSTYHNHLDYYCTLCDGYFTYEPVQKNGTYQISNSPELYWFAEYVNNGNTAASAVLTADITVNTDVLDADGKLSSGDFASWTPIGSSSNQYIGAFDGQGHTISGLYFSDISIDYAGLFGYVGYDTESETFGSVLSVGVADSYLDGGDHVGGVCGYNDGKIEKSYNTGTVRGTGDYIGGVCGTNTGTVTNCYNTGAVIGVISGNSKYEGEFVGGVCGESDGGTVVGCYNTGAVSGDFEVGGVCGYIGNGKMEGCYNTGAVSVTINSGTIVGGVCGQIISSQITNCYSTGAVSGKDSLGGVCGDNYRGEISSCYSTGNVSGTGGSLGGVCGKNEYGTIENSYYLKGKASGGICGSDSDGAAVSKTDTEFASGAVAYLLQSGQEADTETNIVPMVWGQKLTGETKDVLPVLTSESAKTVYKVTFVVKDSETETGYKEYAAAYANPNATVALPAAPTSDTYAFTKWSQTESTSGTEFTADTEVTADITVYAVGEEKYSENDNEKTVTTTYGTEKTQDLSEYAVFAAGTSSAGKFTYEIVSGNDTKLGATIDGETLTIPGTAAAGIYTLTIKAEEKSTRSITYVG
ncbi:MAG: InlB B-repeat-containing protein [Clostridiales bacterium]|nr:InlB B-repeat-containing protein [Clostridiales bacterium]